VSVSGSVRQPILRSGGGARYSNTPPLQPAILRAAAYRAAVHTILPCAEWHGTRCNEPRFPLVELNSGLPANPFFGTFGTSTLSRSGSKPVAAKRPLATVTLVAGASKPPYVRPVVKTCYQQATILRAIQSRRVCDRCDWCGQLRCANCKPDRWPNLADGCCVCRDRVLSRLTAAKATQCRNAPALRTEAAVSQTCRFPFWGITLKGSL
jgi:hypothetical protein